jgi:hypothetical protein
MGVKGPEGREVGREVTRHNLEKAERVGEVLEPMLAEIAQTNPGGKIPCHQVTNSSRDQNLASMPGGADARGAMHVQADVTTRFGQGLPSMQAHAHPQRCAVRPGLLRERLLCGHCCRHGISGPRERRQERVSLRVDLLAVAFGKCIAQQPLVFREDLRVPAIAEALEEGGRPLYVGEEET